MADTGKIYITISDTRGGSGSGRTPDVPNSQSNQDEEEQKTGMLNQYIRHRFFNLVQSQVKQAVNYTVGNIGNFTGNYQSQRDIEQGISAINWLVNIGTSFYTGTKTTGSPIGGAVAAVLTVGSGLISAGYREYTEWFQNRKDNRNIEMMRNRLGLQGLTDGSRTGGY
jgi:hypothetical protein